MKEKFILNGPFATPYYQLESLKRTDTTKKQILETLAAMPEDLLARSLPDVRLEISKQEVLDRADLVLNSKGPGVPDPLIEALVLTHGRPVFFIENGMPVLTGNEIEKWKKLIDDALATLDLRNVIRSTGRIVVYGKPGYNSVGTGWLIADDLIATAAHVGMGFAETGKDGRYQFKVYDDTTASATINFLFEHNNKASATFDIGECVYLNESEKPDVAIFKVKLSEGGSGYHPLMLSDAAPDKRENVAIIGYPGKDNRAKLKDDVNRIYNNTFGVKRLAVGQITEFIHDSYLYDATTMGGCSGGPVYSLQTGKVVGLHYAGIESYGNYSVPSYVLKQIMGEISSKHTHPVIHPIDTDKNNHANKSLSEWEPKGYLKGSVVSYKGKLYRARCYADADKCPISDYIEDAPLKPWVIQPTKTASSEQ